MHELSLAEPADVEALEEGKLLQRHGAGAPRPRLADGRPAVLERDHRLERGAPGSEVFARQQSAFRFREGVDLVGDEAFVKELPRALELRLPRAARRLVDDASIRRGGRRVTELRAEPGYREVEIA